MELQSQMNAVLTSLSLDAKCISATSYRHVASCNVELGPSCRVQHLTNLSQEIALRIKSIKEPKITTIPKEGVVQFRFVMDKADVVKFEDLYNPNEIPAGVLPFLLGEGDDGQKIWMDMSCNPHLLVAGSTGSGKSVLLHVLIANALRRNDVDLYLVDPKFGVEFGKYANKASVANNYNEAITFLEELELLMNSRYKRMAKLGVSSIEQNPGLFTKKLLIVDEVADLMLYDADKTNPNRGLFENKICSIAQKARASGIYLVLATQRPSVDVITGLIKSNFPARLACKVSTAVDSKVVLDRIGAESLLGRGDAILKNDQHYYTRFQVAYIDP